MTFSEGEHLLDYAAAKGLRVGCAPCSVLSNTAQTLWQAIAQGQIGKVRLVYANYDDGLIAPNMRPWEWLNELGVPWPAQDEFEVGCTYEHAAYFLSWLAAIFGPAQRMTAFSSCQIPDKGIPVTQMAPDFTVGCLEYGDGVVARVTCGLVAPRDKSLLVVGDEGYLLVRHLRNDFEPVFLRRERMGQNRKRIENLIDRLRKKMRPLIEALPWPVGEFHLYERVPFALNVPHRSVATPGKRVDFMLGPHDMATAIADNRPHRLSGELALHLLEQIEVLQYPERFSASYSLQST